MSAARWSDVWQQIKDNLNSPLDPLQSDKSVDSALDNWDQHWAFWVMGTRGYTEVMEVKNNVNMCFYLLIQQKAWFYFEGFSGDWSVAEQEFKRLKVTQIIDAADIKVTIK